MNRSHVARGLVTLLLLVGLAGSMLYKRPTVEPQWELVLDRPIRGKYEDLAFPTSAMGWVVSARGEILHTRDGAQSWELQASGLGHLRSLEFLDERRGFAGTLDGVLYRTHDAGLSWEDVTHTLPVPPAGFCGMDHVGEDLHLVGRFVGGAADYYRSSDGGQEWRHTDLSQRAHGLVEVLFIDAQVGFIGGSAPDAAQGLGGALILKTTDGGDSWREVFRLESGRGFAWKLFSTSEDTLHAALQTQDGVLRVATTEDQGESWQVLVVDEGLPGVPGVQAVGFIDDQRGWVAGMFRGLYETRDGGQTWRHLDIAGRGFNRFVRGGGGLLTASRRGVMRLVNPGVGEARPAPDRRSDP